MYVPRELGWGVHRKKEKLGVGGHCSGAQGLRCAAGAWDRDSQLPTLLQRTIKVQLSDYFWTA